MKDIAFCHLTTQGLLACSGINTKKFLQGQLSCDLNKITTENILLGVYCNPQGRVIASFHCFLMDDIIYLQMPALCIDNCLTHLKKYAIFSKVNCYNASNELAIIGLLGQDAAALLPTLSAKKVIKIPGEFPRFEIIISVEDKEKIQQQLSSVASVVNEDSWRLLDIDRGIPTIYPETQEQFLPHRINYHLIDGISFTKGCFVGQEIIARTQYRGTLKHHMYRIELLTSESPQPGTPLFFNKDSSPIGHIVDCVPLDNLHCRALAILAIEYAVDNSVFIGESHQAAVMRILDLPYVYGATK